MGNGLILIKTVSSNALWVGVNDGVSFPSEFSYKGNTFIYGTIITTDIAVYYKEGWVC